MVNIVYPHGALMRVSCVHMLYVVGDGSAVDAASSGCEWWFHCRGSGISALPFCDSGDFTILALEKFLCLEHVRGSADVRVQALLVSIPLLDEPNLKEAEEIYIVMKVKLGHVQGSIARLNTVQNSP